MQADEAIVLVGGRGTRLRSVVSDVPKPLAPVAGRPFLAWVLDRLAAANIRRIILATGYLSESVRTTIGRRWEGSEVDYSVEDEPLGTGGAIRQAAELLSGDIGVHVVNGDTYLEYDLQALERSTILAGARTGVALAQVDDVQRYGALDVTGGLVTGFREKGSKGPGWVNAGCYFLTSRALESLPAEEAFSFETGFLVPETGRGEVAAFTETRGFIDIGIPEDYLVAQGRFSGAP